MNLYSICVFYDWLISLSITSSRFIHIIPCVKMYLCVCVCVCVCVYVCVWTIFKVFIEFVTILLLFYVLVFWPQGMWDLSSLTRNWTRTPFIGRRSLNHWSAREVPECPFLKLINIPLYLYAAFCLSLHLSMDTCVVFISLSWIMLLWTWVWKYLFETLTLILLLLNIYPE